MSNDDYSLTVDKSPIPLRRIDNIRLVTPARNEHPAIVASRLAKSSRLAIDPTYPPDFLIIRGEKQKLDKVRSYPDVQNTRAAFQDPAGNTLVLTNEILISFVGGSSNADRKKLLNSFDVMVIERRAEFWKIRVKNPGEDAPLLLANDLSKVSIVEYAEPNALQAKTFNQLHQYYNEPLWPNQWHLQNTGQGDGTVGADVNAPGAWAITKGSRNIRIVIDDNGVDISHPDLSRNILPGWDFDNNDNDASPPRTGDPRDAHGTACAGIAAAPINGLGVVGIAPKCKIVPLRMAGEHTWSKFADAFDWAAQHGRVISCSWGMTPNNTVSEAIRRAVNSGVIVVCATGNWANGPNIDYPASMAETIAVGASTDQDVRANYSQYGNGLDIVAPGGWGREGGALTIATTDIRGADGYNRAPSPGGDYWNGANDRHGFWGTSAATPLVAGTVALMLSVDPKLWPYGIREILRGSATKIDAANANYDRNGWSTEYGYGRLNAALAVHRAEPPKKVPSRFGYNAGWRVEKHPRFLADLTGNGCADIVGFADDGVWVAINNGDGTFQESQKVLSNFGYSNGGEWLVDAQGWRVEKHPRFLADLTGNGCADIVGFADAGVLFRSA